MGKRRNSTRRRHDNERNSGLDQQRIGDGPGVSERGGILAATTEFRSDPGPSIPSGVNSNNGAGRAESNDISVSEGDVRSIDNDGVGVHRGNQAALNGNHDTSNVLRLVRPTPERVEIEPLPTGFTSAPGTTVYDEIGTDDVRGTEESHGALVSAVDARAAAYRHLDGSGLVERSFDATEFNRICNDPAVFPFVTLGFGAIDISPLLENPLNVLLMADGGGILFIFFEPGVYEVHTAFMKPDREAKSTQGPYIRNVCLAAYRWMFTHTDCLMLLTRIPGHNRAATIFAPLVGWVKEFERKEIWPTLDGNKVDLTFWSINYRDWVRKTPDLVDSGRWFHQRLAEEMARHGRTEPHHPDEDCHDLHVGACVEMIFGGQFEKGIALYNGWARFSGYGTLNIISRSPRLLDIGDALLQITEETFKVVKVS